MVGEAMGVIQEIDAALLVIDVDVAMQVGGGKAGWAIRRRDPARSWPRRAARSCWRSTRSTR